MNTVPYLKNMQDFWLPTHGCRTLVTLWRSGVQNAIANPGGGGQSQVAYLAARPLRQEAPGFNPVGFCGSICHRCQVRWTSPVTCHHSSPLAARVHTILPAGVLQPGAFLPTQQAGHKSLFFPPVPRQPQILWSSSDL